MFGLPFRLTDAVTLGGLLFLTLLAVVFNRRLDRPLVIIGTNLLWIAVYVGSLAVLARLKKRILRFSIRTVVVQLTFLQVFMAGCHLQLLFLTWQDETVLAWEKAIFGTQPLVWIQKFYSPWLSEWMFFTYVVYIILYPIIGAITFYKHGEDANESYLFHLGLVNLVCAIGFIAFPVASPMHWEKIRVLLTKPFELGPFGLAAEYIRQHIHTPGGSIPSPHCALASVMWFMSFKYARRIFFLLIPIMLSLYVSTVYGRFHYVSDMVIGIAVAALIILVAPSIERRGDKRTKRK